MASALLKPLLPSSISALRDVAEADLHRLRNVLPELLFRRVRHVVSENGRVLRCVDALRSGRFDEVGSLLEESHRSLRDDFEVSCPELDLLVEIASRTRGVLGGRLTGAGFGGCTISLVQLSALDTFRTNVLGEYQAKTGRSPRTYICRAANGAKLI